jgi:hypothetical protein
VGTLSATGKRVVLEAVTRGPLWLGLATALRDDSLVEESDAAYARQPVRFAEPEESDNRWEAASAERVEFPPYAADARAEVTRWFLIDAFVGGELRASGRLDRALRPVAGGSVFFMPGKVVVRADDAA